MILYKPKLKSQRDVSRDKHKHKFRQRIAALALAISTMLTVLPVTALAASWSGDVISFATEAKVGEYNFGYNSANNLSWRVDLYVSSREDGTLDPTADSVSGLGNAEFVGSILYTQESFNGSVYIQTENSTFKRSSFSSFSQTVLEQVYIKTNSYSGNAKIAYYNLPQVTPISASTKSITFSNHVSGSLYRDTMYIVNEPAPNGLPMDIDNVKEGVVEEKVSTPEFTSAVINNLKERMGESQLLMKLSDCIHSTIINPYLQEFQNTKDWEVFAPLYPTADEPLVEWMAVVSPMIQYNANSGNSVGMWFINDDTYRDRASSIYDRDENDELIYSSNEPVVPKIASPSSEGNVAKVTLILDAYTAAQYNSVTKAEGQFGIYSLKALHGAMVEAGVSIPKERMIDYQNIGVMRKEYGSLFKNIATASLVDEDTDPYFGVNCSTVYTDFSSDNTMAKQGGIGIYVTEIKDTAKIPVYYYVYDENNNFLRKETDSYTQNETHTFQPSTDYGTPIAMESTSRGDTRFYGFETMPRKGCVVNFARY